ncbi:Chromosomal replication initiator protein DnaA [Coxiella endosymbiont of Amblyomma nuttalli]|nr:Chromosomal replication initiator protein DnaA [Coxiella endosymbiont of Amblyomma nuttalli]
MSVSVLLWDKCLGYLRDEIPSQQYNTWILLLHAIESKKNRLLSLTPNRFVLDWINERFLIRIKELLDELSDTLTKIELQIGSKSTVEIEYIPGEITRKMTTTTVVAYPQTNINSGFIFNTFVEGKSNQLARAAAIQVVENPGQAYNSLFVYGGVELGKTHLMHAVGNTVLQKNPSMKILYLHSERFVADMIKALQHNMMDECKRFYRFINILLIDDIQFFAEKSRPQEEFFHTFNALLDNQQQIILTYNRYPKEINRLEERLQSRFGWRLMVTMKPPDLETRVTILMAKADQLNVHIPHEIACFVAKHIQSNNVRELEGALKQVIANTHFIGQLITIAFTKNALKDLLTLQARSVTIENIQKTVAEYYKIKGSDLLAKRHSRSITQPRQIAMELAKELLTNRSISEISVMPLVAEIIPLFYMLVVKSRCLLHRLIFWKITRTWYVSCLPN